MTGRTDEHSYVDGWCDYWDGATKNRAVWEAQPCVRCRTALHVPTPPQNADEADR